MTSRRYLNRLRKYGYVKAIQTPRGLSLIVTKAFKVFGGVVTNEQSQRVANSEQSPKKRVYKSEQSDRTNVNTQGNKSEHSNKTVTTDSNSKTNTLKELDKRLFQFFYTTFEIAPKSPAIELKYARSVHKQYGIEKAEGLVKAAAAARGAEYAPAIHSLKDLWFKVDKLADFYRRNKPKSPNVVKI